MNEAPSLAQEMAAIYALAEKDPSLPRLLEAIFALLPRHEAELQGLSHSYRLHATDTDYTAAFSLNHGHFSLLSVNAPAEVTLFGKEGDLLLILQHKLSPVTALLLRKVKVQGQQKALLKLAEFL